MVKELFAAMHVRRWLKNIFMLAPLAFGLKLGVPDLIRRSVVAFGCLCLLSSVSYLINDLVDSERDRYHPAKLNRPLASGRLHRSWAVSSASVCRTTPL